MDAGAQMRIEVTTLHELLDELNYYSLLRINPDCVQGDIEPAVRSATKQHHPDRVNALKDAELSRAASEVFQRIKEAGENLQDPDSVHSTMRFSRQAFYG